MNCKTCKYWFQRRERKEVGDCLKISNDDTPIQQVVVGKFENEKRGTVVCVDGVLTGCDFGCKFYSKIK